MQPSDVPDLTYLFATLAALVVAFWLVAMRFSRHAPGTQAAKGKSKPKYPPRDKLQGVKVTPTDYTPARTARGQRKRDLTQMLKLAGKPTTGRQRVILRKQLNRVAQGAA